LEVTQLITRAQKVTANGVVRRLDMVMEAVAFEQRGHTVAVARHETNPARLPVETH